jgi:hypothetical protein
MRAVVDRIEGPVAVLISCDDAMLRFTLPAVLLPEGTREGDVVAISIVQDSEATRAAKDRVSGLAAELAGRK